MEVNIPPPIQERCEEFVRDYKNDDSDVPVPRTEFSFAGWIEESGMLLKITNGILDKLYYSSLIFIV
jgi:hypothetical protein